MEILIETLKKENCLYLPKFVNQNSSVHVNSGANIPTGKDAPVQPQFTKVTWKATRMVEKRTKWALIWAKNHEVEILFTPQGKFDKFYLGILKYY